MEAFKLQGGEANAKKRKAVEELLLGYMKATAPEKYHKDLTPNYPVRKLGPTVYLNSDIFITAWVQAACI